LELIGIEAVDQGRTTYVLLFSVDGLYLRPRKELLISRWLGLTLER